MAGHRSRPSTSSLGWTLKTWMPGIANKFTQFARKLLWPGMTKNGDVTLFSIPIMIRLERAFRLDADILGLVGTQFCQFHADLGEMQPRHFLVERFRQHVDLLLVFAVLVVGVELDLRQRLVGE